MIKNMDNDIAALKLDDVEKTAMQVYRNYTKAFQRRRAELIDEETSQLNFDYDHFELELSQLENSSIENSILGCIAIADELLKAMFLRDDRARLQIKSLLGPLGPIGDFNKRLKVASLAGFIDENDLIFFDELRKMRNRIAHSTQPRPPKPSELEKINCVSSEWLNALINEGEISDDFDHNSPDVFRSLMLVQLSKLAWGTLLRPYALKAQVPFEIIIEKQPTVFKRLSKLGVKRAINILSDK